MCTSSNKKVLDFFQKQEWRVRTRSAMSCTGACSAAPLSRPSTTTAASSTWTTAWTSAIPFSGIPVHWGHTDPATRKLIPKVAQIYTICSHIFLSTSFFFLVVVPQVSTRSVRRSTPTPFTVAPYAAPPMWTV